MQMQIKTCLLTSAKFVYKAKAEVTDTSIVPGYYGHDRRVTLTSK